MHAVDAVDDLPAVSVDVDEVADLRAVGDLDLPREVVLARDALREPFPEHVQRGRAGPQRVDVATLRDDRSSSHARGALAAPGRGLADGDVGDGRAGDRLELVRGVEVRLDRAREDGDRSVELLPREVRVAESVRLGLREAERRGVVDPDRQAVRSEERHRLALLLFGRPRGGVAERCG